MSTIPTHEVLPITKAAYDQAIPEVRNGVESLEFIRTVVHRATRLRIEEFGRMNAQFPDCDNETYIALVDQWSEDSGDRELVKLIHELVWLAEDLLSEPD